MSGNKLLAVVVAVIFLALLFDQASAAVKAKLEVVDMVVDMGDYILFYSTTAKEGSFNPDGSDVIIYCHGGFAETNKACTDCRFLAHEGYAVASVMYGAAKSLQDDLEAVSRVRNDFTGAKTIFLMGVSRGGFLALQSFLTENDLYDGAVIVAAPTSVSNWRTTFPLSPQEKAYFASGIDAVANAGLIQKPMYLLYGTDDDVVPASQGEMLWEKNPELFEFKTLPADHSLMESGEALVLISDWLEGVIASAEK